MKSYEAPTETFSHRALELRQYKNDSIQSTKIPILKILLSECSRSYLVFALILQRTEGISFLDAITRAHVICPLRKNATQKRGEKERNAFYFFLIFSADFFAIIAHCLHVNQKRKNTCMDLLKSFSERITSNSNIFPLFAITFKLIENRPLIHRI